MWHCAGWVEQANGVPFRLIMTGPNAAIGFSALGKHLQVIRHNRRERMDPCTTEAESSAV
jgi:hypothetical protein